MSHLSWFYGLEERQDRGRAGLQGLLPDTGTGVRKGVASSEVPRFLCQGESSLEGHVKQMWNCLSITLPLCY